MSDTVDDQDEAFEDLLQFVKRSRGFDFSGYKRASLMRRVRRRMDQVHLDSFQEYTDFLQVHPDEFIALFNTILINVTSFFRDPQIWDYVRTEVVPTLASRKGSSEPIRAWCAGCASGQETYTLAMLMAEGLGVEDFKERVKIYATDVDQEALAQARAAMYTPKETTDIPRELLGRYFEAAGPNYAFRKDLRRSVIFGRHDLVQDAPISRVDLIVCRNTLMYFNAETQGRIMTRFDFALNQGGFLLLGKAEMLFTHLKAFVPLDLRRRVFVKSGELDLRDRLLMMPAGLDDDRSEGGLAVNFNTAFDAAPIAQLIVDTSGVLAMANRGARELFGIDSKDVGRPVQDLELSYRPVELRSLIDQAQGDARPVSLKHVAWQRGDRRQYLDVDVLPLADGDGRSLGVSVTFTDVTVFAALEEDLNRSSQELETAMEELQSTNEELETTNEELETTNEELQSTNEELETTNEELQSTNEELETMNEELQSTNEELQATNDELRIRSDELDQVNSFLGAVLTSVRAGLAVLDHDLRLRAWNAEAEDLWGVRSDEVAGQAFLSLDIGLPVRRLRDALFNALEGQTVPPQEFEATNRRGRPILCKVTCNPLVERGESRGVIVLMESVTAD